MPRGGRAGLNIVCGWSPQEFALFGLTMIEDRYAQGLEWVEIMERIFAGGRAVRLRRGGSTSCKSVSGQPAPLQRPRPVTLNAAFSPVGRDFAAKAADFLFTTFVDIEGGRPHIADMAARARAAGREVGVFTTCHVVCRPTQTEAEDYYEHYAVTMEDTASVDFYMGAKEKFSGSHDPEAYRLHRKRFVGGAGTYPLIGTPRMIAEEMVRMSEVGFAGTTVVVRELHRRVAVFHRDSAAAAARGRSARRIRNVSAARQNHHLLRPRRLSDAGPLRAHATPASTPSRCATREELDAAHRRGRRTGGLRPVAQRRSLARATRLRFIQSIGAGTDQFSRDAAGEAAAYGWPAPPG